MGVVADVGCGRGCGSGFDGKCGSECNMYI